MHPGPPPQTRPVLPALCGDDVRGLSPWIPWRSLHCSQRDDTQRWWMLISHFSSSKRPCGFFLVPLKKIFFHDSEAFMYVMFYALWSSSPLAMLFGPLSSPCLSPWRSHDAQEKTEKNCLVALFPQHIRACGRARSKQV